MGMAKHNQVGGGTSATTEYISAEEDMWFFDNLPRNVRIVMRELIVGPMGARDVYFAIKRGMPPEVAAARLKAQTIAIARTDWLKTFGEAYPCK